MVIFGDQVYPNSFFLDPVTPSEIESEILLTPLNKVYGLYSCPILILKGANHFVSATLAEIMNMSVQTGVYPSKLKHAKVSPVYKTGDRTEPGNYRPISLLSVFNRLFKRLMHKRLTAFIEKKKHILYNAQYGFRANCSTQQAILDIVNRIQSNLDAGLHTILLCKLSHYGIRGIINDWFASRLTHRTQTTQLEASISSKGKIVFGVPHRAVAFLNLY